MKSILFVEDNEAFRELVMKIISPHFKVHALPNGITALAFLRSEPLPDLIMTDLRLPGLDGLAFLKSVKTSGLYRDIPVVVLSGQREQETIDRCVELGVARYFTKPFDPATLIAKLKELAVSQPTNPC